MFCTNREEIRERTNVILLTGLLVTGFESALEIGWTHLV